MTREEAIKELKIFSGTTRIRLSANFWEALNTVIKALEQEPCEDAVSRKKIEKLKRWRFSYDTNTTIPKSDLFVRLTDIRDLPPITPTVCIAKVTFNKDDLQKLVDEKIKEIVVERKKGHWILLDECANSGYYCSKCRKKVVKEGWSETVKKIKYCPNCGIEMVGVRNEH